MNCKLSENFIKFLSEEIGLDDSAIKLGLLISAKNNCPLPISLWSYGLINSDELDHLYTYLFQNI